MSAWRARRDEVQARQSSIEAQRLSGQWSPVYRFDEGVLSDADIAMTDQTLVMGDKKIVLRSAVPDEWRLD